MGYKMKGSPAKMGTIQGTAGHASALKKKKDIHELVERRRELKAKQEKLENRKKEGKKTILGDFRRKRKERQIERVQEKINKDPKAQEWKRKGELPKWYKGGVATTGDSPAKHLVGKHPGKDGHERSDHKAKRQTRKDDRTMGKPGKNTYKEDLATRRELKSKGKSVETSRKMRKLQNRINISKGSDVRHTKKFLGKYKRENVERY